MSCFSWTQYLKDDRNETASFECHSTWTEKGGAVLEKQKVDIKEILIIKVLNVVSMSEGKKLLQGGILHSSGISSETCCLHLPSPSASSKTKSASSLTLLG